MTMSIFSCIYFFGEVSDQIFCPLKTCGLFSYYWILSFLNIFWIQELYQIRSLQIFSPVCSFFFSSLNIIFWRAFFVCFFFIIFFIILFFTKDILKETLRKTRILKLEISKNEMKNAVESLWGRAKQMEDRISDLGVEIVK